MRHRRHVIQWLSAYVHGELPTDSARRVADHLQECARCRRRFETIAQGARLAFHLPLQAAPASLDRSLRQALTSKASSTDAQAVPRRPWMRAALIGAAVASLVLMFWMYTARSTAVDLASYLDQVQARETATDAIGGPPFAFQEISAASALEVAGVRSTLASPLDGYVLRNARVLAVARQRVVQLVYARDGDEFTVFVAPKQIPFAFGDRASEPERVDNMPCRRVDCPRTTTVLFGEGAFHCVLVSRVRDDRSTGDIMRYFVRAHAIPSS